MLVWVMNILAEIVHSYFGCFVRFDMIKYIYNDCMITYGGVWEEFLIRTRQSWLLNVFGKMVGVQLKGK